MRASRLIMLYVVATPIGDYNEISLRGLEALSSAEIIICESTKEASQLLRFHKISGKKYELLNEHSTGDDIQKLVKLCEQHTCALVSDAGTPGFCDPGSTLISLCRKKNILVKSILGPSCLMGLLSLSGEYLHQFVFRGFLPAENVAREKALLELTREKRAIVIMDTPYRLKKTLTDMQNFFKDRRFLLALNLSQENEKIIEGSIQDIIKKLDREKAEFILLIYAQ